VAAKGSLSTDKSRRDPQAIREFVRANLARYQIPRDVVFVDDLPRNPTGKLLRRELPTGPLDGIPNLLPPTKSPAESDE
jgi:fatty-acyl-CoA synthase